MIEIVLVKGNGILSYNRVLSLWWRKDNMWLLYCLILFCYISTYPCDQKQYALSEYIRYAYDNNLHMPPYVESIKAYLNVNEYGFSFDPIDPLSMAFIYDVTQHRNVSTQTCVLDVGCGLGLLAQRVLTSSARDNTLSYVGLDLSRDNLAIATREIVENSTDNCWNAWQPIVGKFPDVDLASKQFTHIALFHVFHFLTPDECIQSLQKIEQLLIRGGKAYIYTSHPFSEIASSMRYDAHYGDFPGFIEDAPAYFKNLVQTGVRSSMFTKNYVPHFLYLKTEELCMLIMEYTHLKIDYACTINEHRCGGKIFAGVIVRK